MVNFMQDLKHTITIPGENGQKLQRFINSDLPEGSTRNICTDVEDAYSIVRNSQTPQKVKLFEKHSAENGLLHRKALALSPALLRNESNSLAPRLSYENRHTQIVKESVYYSVHNCNPITISPRFSTNVYTPIKEVPTSPTRKATCVPPISEELALIIKSAVPPPRLSIASTLKLRIKKQQLAIQDGVVHATSTRGKNLKIIKAKSGSVMEVIQEDPLNKQSGSNNNESNLAEQNKEGVSLTKEDFVSLKKGLNISEEELMFLFPLLKITMLLSPCRISTYEIQFMEPTITYS